SSPARRSRHEPLIVLNGFHALIHRKSVANANPFLPRITHEVEGKLAATEGFHPCKFPDPTGLQVLKKCRVSGRRHFCHPTSFQGRGCENGRSTEDPASGS